MKDISYKFIVDCLTYYYATTTLPNMKSELLTLHLKNNVLEGVHIVDRM